MTAVILTRIINHGKKLDHQLQSLIDDKPFIQKLSYGVCRYYFRLLAITKLLLHKPLPKKHHDILALILIGLYQLIYLDTKSFAAINESVAAANQLGKPWATRLINAALRQFQRQSTNLLIKIEQDQQAKYAHPHWLINELQSAWPQNWQAILTYNNQPAPLTLRVNQQKIDRQCYIEKLRAINITATPCEYSEVGIQLSTPLAVTTLPGFSSGEISVQDEAAQFAASLLDLQAGQRILDACAAPGGKTCHILETEPNIELLAIDSHKIRKQRLEENLARLQLSATLITADAAQPESWWDGKLFDRILLDAPCSATGVIRRHPDIKLLRKKSELKTLTQTQYRLLKNLWTLLKPGGILVYATCSILPEENIKLIASFLSVQADAQVIPLSVAWGKSLPFGQQILPEKMDGFYYAKLIKQNDAKQV